MLNEAARVDAEERQAQMRAEIEQLRNSLRKHKRHEKQLLEETNQLQERLDDVTNVNLHLNERLAEQVRPSTDVIQAAEAINQSEARTIVYVYVLGVRSSQEGIERN